MSLETVLELLCHPSYLPEGRALAAAISEHELDITQLPTLSLEDLKEMGFAKLGPRKRALDKLQLVVGSVSEV